MPTPRPGFDNRLARQVAHHRRVLDRHTREALRAAVGVVALLRQMLNRTDLARGPATRRTRSHPHMAAPQARPLRQMAAMQQRRRADVLVRVAVEARRKLERQPALAVRVRKQVVAAVAAAAGVTDKQVAQAVQAAQAAC